jgi:hypothetical protein
VRRKGIYLLVAASVAVLAVGGTAVAKNLSGNVTRGGVEVTTGHAAPAAVESGTCDTVKQNFVAASDGGLSTTSTTYVDVPSMTSTFTVGGTGKSCLTVMFTGYSYASSDELIMIQALLDGTRASKQTDVLFSGDDDEDSDGKWARAHAWVFDFKNVTAGSHTITIQWKSYSGGQVFMHQRTMVILHK